MSEAKKIHTVKVSPDARKMAEYWQQAGIKLLHKDYRDEAARTYFLSSTFPDLTAGEILRLAQGEKWDEVIKSELKSGREDG